MRNDILTAREKKVYEVNELLSKNHVTVLIKANIPGIDKNIAEAHFLVRLFSLYIQKSYQIKQTFSKESLDGPYDILIIHQISASKLKNDLIKIETTHPLGRFIDLDVFSDKPESLSRLDLNLPPRKCYICGKDAHICSRTLKHSIGILLNHIDLEVKNYLRDQIELIITHSIFKELDLDYKFGLVSKNSNGSHVDMNYDIMKSAEIAILPFLVDLFILGYESKELKNLLSQSRPVGIDAESKMLKVTGGINAYKGLIFILGLTLLSLGYALKHNQIFEDIFENIKEMTHSIYDDFKKKEQTAGIQAFQKYRISGIRGEVTHGLISVKSALQLLTDESDLTLRQVLKHLILISEDTVFLKRSKSLETYHHIKQLIQDTDISDLDELMKMNQLMIDKNISFGGSADLLIVTIFLKSIKMKFFS